MSLSLKGGFIYFLRERDVLDCKNSPYVKIGKTDHKRPVAKRIEDHQTGNPREIILNHAFETLGVDTVETHLHHAFAQYRV